MTEFTEEVEPYDFEIPEMRTATCATENCANYGIPITRMLVAKVLCGGCGEFIEDVTEVTDGNSR